MPKIAFYPGTFDPLTNGHLDVLRGALALADTVVVAIGTHPGKAPIFTAEERGAMIIAASRSLGRGAAARISVTSFDDLTVAAAKRAGAAILIRGLRDSADFDYEMQLAGMNAALSPGVQTVFLPAAPGTRHITATLVRQIARMGGDVSAFVPAAVAARLAKKFKS